MHKIYNEDAVKWAENYEGERFHALFCDAPYHLTSIVKRFGKNGSAPAKFGSDGVFSRSSRGFMGQQWDGGDIAFQPETWNAFGEVMFDGAFGMAFSASRNWHRMAVAIEDAGFVIHPTMFFLWVQSQGFPKATKVRADGFDGYKYGLQALKPAVEPVIIFQKPYVGRPVDNIVSTGAGVLNIDGARIPLDDGDGYVINEFEDGMKPFGNGAGHKYKSRKIHAPKSNPANRNGVVGADLGISNASLLDFQEAQRLSVEKANTLGRYPANLVLDSQIELEQGNFFTQVSTQIDEADPYFYCGKVAPKERNAGLGDAEDVLRAQSGGAQGAVGRQETEYKQDSIETNRVSVVKNPHPTLKPIELCKHLATLLLPPAQYAPRRIFVPFSGVGSEMIGALLAGWEEVVGVEFDKENDYVGIAEKRIGHWVK